MTSHRHFAVFVLLMTVFLSGQIHAADVAPPVNGNPAQLWEWVFAGSGDGGEGDASSLQVTVEVRFITLNDNFFEELGVDFDFDLGDAASFPVGPEINRTGTDPDFDTPVDPSLPTADNPFLGASIPFIGEPGATAFGTAILSDIEAFFFLEAVQGDRRNNIVNAPQVTLFNGQTANISPPRTGIAGFLSMIQVFPEGQILSVQPVVSADRRFVRLSVMPVLNPIGNSGLFSNSFAGLFWWWPSPVPTLPELPEVDFAKKFATVAVEDGGVILLGGVKRLREGRNERGVPLLSKLPYVNRLFRNVGIGRETDSLMMMVTPRIIIQEEEE